MKKILFILSLVFALFIFSIDLVVAQTKTLHRKHWSHKAKDATIGAGAGAATGAIISKDHSKGAIIGGAAGAGAGYIIGKHKDKKAKQ